MSVSGRLRALSVDLEEDISGYEQRQRDWACLRSTYKIPVDKYIDHLVQIKMIVDDIRFDVDLEDSKQLELPFDEY